MCLVYAYFRVPEPGGRTFAELDLLFERGVSARKFKETKVDVFDVALSHQMWEQKAVGSQHHEKVAPSA